MKATELIEDLERQVSEFGDGEVVLPDALENWWYLVDHVELDLANQRFKLCPED